MYWNKYLDLKCTIPKSNYPNNLIPIPTLLLWTRCTDALDEMKNSYSNFYICNVNSVTSKKLPNVYKSSLNMISLEKLKISTPLQKLPNNVVVLGKLIDATGFEKLPKVQ